MKRCSRCKEEKPFELFNRKTKSKSGFTSECKACLRKSSQRHYQENKVNILAATKIYNDKHKAETSERKRRLKPLKYGLTLEQFDEMMLNQGGMCAICDRERNLHIDHNHVTGKVRSLLCGACNRGIGLLQESSGVITKAAEYIKKHSAP